MGCSHCAINAGPDGKHMPMAIFEQALKFISWTGFPFIMLTGGEPTLHPEFMEILQMAVNKKLKTLLLSNGSFLENDILTKRILKTGVLIQITNDDRFYPQRVPVISHPQIMYENRIRLVSPFGRALTNKIETKRQSPTCFNLRSVTRNVRDFIAGVQLLRGVQKFCTPSINIDGSIAAGEMNTCTTFGTVYDSNLALTNNLCSMTCKKCGLVNNLPAQHKEVIGEL
jgi:hypothetical protein